MTGFWIFMLLCLMLVPFVMIGFGGLFSKSAPKTINATFGYRTKRSMKNRDTWDYAHKVCGRVWRRWGVVLLIVSVLAMLLCLGKDTATVGYWSVLIMAAQILVLLLSILPVERALKKEFDEFGHRRA